MEEEVKESPVQRALSVIITVLLIFSVLLCLYVTIQVLSDGFVNIGGFMMFRVVTGSMEPTMHVGSLMVTREVDISTVALHDIICFRTQEAAIWGKIVTHRVVDIVPMADGSNWLVTKGDANLVNDSYYVNQDNFVGKVVWYTGDDSILASIFSFFTNEIGFLACIVLPCLLLVSFILKDCVNNIRKELQEAMEEAEVETETKAVDEDWRNDPLCGMTQEEYNEMYERIRAELIEELMHCAEISEAIKRIAEQSEPKTE